MAATELTEVEPKVEESEYNSQADTALLSHYDENTAAAAANGSDDSAAAGHDIEAYSDIKTRAVNPRLDLGLRGLSTTLLILLYNGLARISGRKGLNVNAPSSSTGAGPGASGPTNTIPRGFWPIMRWVFNYPEPGLRLRKTAWLDALRGLAAFNVFIFHWSEEWVMKDAIWGSADGEWNRPDAWWAAPFLRLIFDGGSAAVSLFFVISGYVLTHRILGLIRAQQTDEVFTALSSAVMRRGIRLYMPVIILTFILMNWAWFTGWPLARVLDYEETYFKELWRWANEITRLWMPVRGQILNPYDGTVSWTIPFEFYGSITVWVALLFTARITSFSLRTAIFLVMTFMYTVTGEWYVVQFLLGAIYAEYHLVRDEQADQPRPAATTQPPSRLGRIFTRKAAVICILIVGLYVSSMPGHWTNLLTDELQPRPWFDWFIPPRSWYRWIQVDRFIWDFGADCILVACGELQPLQRLLEKRPFQYLGRITFGLYLCHMTVRGLMKPLDNTYLRLWGLEGTIYDQVAGWRYAGAFWTRVLIGMPVLFFFAGLFERYVDRPSIEMGRQFERFTLRVGRKSR